MKKRLIWKLQNLGKILPRHGVFTSLRCTPSQTKTVSQLSGRIMEEEAGGSSQPERKTFSEDIFLLFEQNITNNEVKRNSLYQIIEHLPLQNNLQVEIVVDALYLAIEFCVSKKLKYTPTGILVKLILEEFEKLMAEDRQSLLPQEQFVTSPAARITNHMQNLSLEDDDSLSSPKHYPYEGFFASDSYEVEVRSWIAKFHSLYEEHGTEIDLKVWKVLSAYFIQHVLPDLPTYEYMLTHPPIVDDRGVSLTVVVDTPLNNLLPLQSVAVPPAS